MKLKKRIGIVLTTLLAVLLAFAFAACANETGEGGSTNCEHAHYSLLSDANQHWEECDECGDKRNVENHYDLNHDGKCDKEGCGATVSGGGETCQHPADQITFVEIPGNDNEHTKHCNACNTDIGTEYHVYPLSEGDSVCSKCNHTCAHSGKAWQAGKTTHYESCVYCYKQLTQPEAHHMEEGVCETCGITQDEIDEFPDENASDFGICGNGQGKLLVSDNYTAYDRNRLSKDVTWDGAGEKSSITANFYQGDCFKVTDGSTWLGYDKVNEGKNYVSGVDDGFGGTNIQFNQDGNYTITYYSSPVKIDIVLNNTIGTIYETKQFYLVGSFNAAAMQMWNLDIREHPFTYDAELKMWKADVTIAAADIPPTTWNDGTDASYKAGAAKVDILDLDYTKSALNKAIWVEPGDYTFYWNLKTLSYTEQGQDAPELGKWYLSGEGTGATFAGKPTFAQNPEHAFHDNGDGIYVFTATFAVGDRFKVTDGGVWLGASAMKSAPAGAFEEDTSDGYGNIKVKIAGTYLITFDENSKTFTITTSEPAHQHNIDNDNWTKDVTGHWHACDSCSEKFDFSGHTYDDTECTTCGFPKPTTDPTDDEDTRAWYILGKGKGSLKGNNWNHKSTVTLTKGEGNVFTATVTLYAGDEFKLAYGGAWTQDEEHPNVGSLGKSAVWQGAGLFDGDDNLVVKADGEYTITLYTFITNKDSELQQDHFDVVKTETVVEPKPENYSMYLVGTINEEDPNTWTDNFTADTKLTSDGHGVWTITFTVTEQMYVTTWGAEENGSAYIKVKNDVYGEDYGANGGNVKLSAGTYVITFKESDGSVTAVASHDHTWAEEWSHDENTHWHACTQDGCTARNDEAEHTFNGGECVCGEKEPVDDTNDTVIVHFHNTKKNIPTTGSVYVYYGGGNTHPLGDWPGKSGMITDEGDGWIRTTFTVPKGVVGTDLCIIFNDGKKDNANQTGDIKVTAKEVWVNVNEVAFESKEEALAGEEAEPTRTYTFHFYNSKNWSKIGIHLWGDGIGNITGGWNTSFMEKDTELGDKWYKYTYEIFDDTNWTGKKLNVIIFNSTSDSNRITVGDSKTPITVSGTDFYFHAAKDQQWFTSADAALGVASSALVAMLPVSDDRLVA